MKNRVDRYIKEIDGITAFEIFKKIGKRGDFILESSLKNELGRFTIAGLVPYQSIEEDGTFRIDGKISEGNALAYIKKYMKENRITDETVEGMGISKGDIPFIDGCIGYFTYGFGMKQMGIKSKHQEKIDMPKAMFKFYDLVVVEDHEKSKVCLIGNGKTKDGKLLVEEKLNEINKGEKSKGLDAYNAGYFAKGFSCHITNPQNENCICSDENNWLCDFEKAEYKTAISDMIEHIYDGDIYVVNMTQQLCLESKEKPFDVYHRLRKNNPAPFSAFIEEDDYSIVCASPERFLKCEDGKVVTRPIKGTRRRGANAEEDSQLREELANSEKDQCELRMIVDLERNDLNKVCEPGSVNVPTMFEIEEYATVFHLSSTVEGELKDRDVTDLIVAAFPGGSITGAPKRRAMELIDDIEKSARGLYTGSIGYIGLDGNCDFNIVIRTVVYQNGKYRMGAGGGITCESELEFEYGEVFQKAVALKKAIMGKDA